MFQKAEKLYVQILILVKSFNTIESNPQALLYVPLKMFLINYMKRENFLL